MNLHNRVAYATVTFAVFEDAPIACQGNDDQNKIQVVKFRMAQDASLHADALRCAMTLAATHGTHVLVWDVEFTRL